VVVLHDITERRKLEQIRKEFVANVSHELRTPITAIQGFAETLLDEDLSPEQARQFMQILRDEADRLSHLTQDLLELSRLESGSVRFDKKEVEIGSLVAAVVEKMMNHVKQSGLSIEYEPDGEGHFAWVDAMRIQQVLINLIENAVKYTPPGGKIFVNVVEKDRYVVITVRDTGIGIPEQDCERIFERFYRVDKARSRKSGGTGLGLSISKHIVEAHGGYITVHSEVDKGSTFAVHLPKSAPEKSGQGG
jgi:two-component system phosphate regulon sensor histidine kinase PhoR